MNKKIDLSYLAKAWPSPIIPRTKASDFTGGVIGAKYLANLDSQGQGPPGRFKIGRKTVYPVKQFIEWLEDRTAQ